MDYASTLQSVKDDRKAGKALHWTAEENKLANDDWTPGGAGVALVFDPTPGGRLNPETGTKSFGMRAPGLIVTKFFEDPEATAIQFANLLEAAMRIAGEGMLYEKSHVSEEHG